jgi:hypothetical protein
MPIARSATPFPDAPSAFDHVMLPAGSAPSEISGGANRRFPWQPPLSRIF